MEYTVIFFRYLNFTDSAFMMRASIEQACATESIILMNRDLKKYVALYYAFNGEKKVKYFFHEI